jgi:cytochrome P450
MELRVALQAFLRRIPEFAVVDDESVRYAGGQIRGPRDLPIVLGARPGSLVTA